MVGARFMEWCTGLKKHGNYYSGFVERLEPVLESHRIATTTTWGTRTSTTHGSTNCAGRKRSTVEGADTEDAAGHTRTKRVKGVDDHDGDKENDSTMVGTLMLMFVLELRL